MRELDALRVLGTPEESAYDGIAEVAAAIFEAPVALVTLMDADRQWFKAKVGTDLCGTSREVAFCTHTILGTRTLVVEDATLDPRFRDNPLVVGGPGIRFYAGTPMVTSAGQSVGSVCVLDVRPRQIEARRLRLLERLARIAVELMEGERLIRELSERVNP